MLPWKLKETMKTVKPIRAEYLKIISAEFLKAICLEISCNDSSADFFS